MHQMSKRIKYENNHQAATIHFAQQVSPAALVRATPISYAKLVAEGERPLVHSEHSIKITGRHEPGHVFVQDGLVTLLRASVHSHDIDNEGFIGEQTG